MNSFISSLQKNLKGIIFILMSAMLVPFGQMLWKLSDGKIGWYMFWGFFIYGLGAVFMIIAFRYGSFSVLHPMMSLNYLFAMIIGACILNERISPMRVLGVLIIVSGVMLIGGGDNN